MLKINSTCYADSEIDTPNLKKPIVATSAGHNILLTKGEIHTKRQGRLDYQLLYVKNGSIHYYVEEQEMIAPAGSVLIYHPKQEQHYKYTMADNSDVYWVHFTGNSVRSILEMLNLDQKLCYKGICDLEYEYCFDKIIEELLYRRQYYMEKSSLQMQLLLYAISRNIITRNKNSHYFTTDNIVKSVYDIINASYQKTIIFADLAKKFYISPSRLTKIFKNQYGVSPLTYLTKLRIEKAKAFLLSDMSVSEVAKAVGYNDQFYFCRIFHKETGISPSEYRKKKYDKKLAAKEEEGILIKRRK